MTKKNTGRAVVTAIEKIIVDLYSDDCRYDKKKISKNITITGYIRKFNRSRSTIIIINERGVYNVSAN